MYFVRGVTKVHRDLDDTRHRSRDDTHRHVIEGDVSHVVVRAALPRVVQTETKSAGVSSVKSDEFAESAVLDVDRPVVDLHSTNREVPAGAITRQINTHDGTFGQCNAMDCEQIKIWTEKTFTFTKSRILCIHTILFLSCLEKKQDNLIEICIIII